MSDLIKNLAIKNFKSIERTSIECKRVNVFIGEPDTGKTNVLEALGVLSWLGCGGASLAQYTRLYPPFLAYNMFFQGVKESPFQISINDLNLHGTYVNNEQVHLNFIFSQPNQAWRNQVPMNGDNGGHLRNTPLLGIKFYRPVDQLRVEMTDGSDSLLPPFGQNLASLISKNAAGLQDYAQSLLENSGLKLMLDQFHQQWVLAAVQEKALITYSLNSLSDTYKRMIFYSAILRTLKNSVVILDEPDVHAFPPYPKMLGERIALDENGNQFFLTTHNPYFLMSLISKTKREELGVFLTSRKANGATEIRNLSEPEKLQRILDLDADVFFNLNDL